MAPLQPGIQPVRTPRGQTYGAAKAQEEAQAAQPLPTSPTHSNLSQLPTSGQARREDRTATGPQPGQLPGLSDPSANPGEPITAGLSTGPGPGPEALLAAPFGPEELSVIRGIYLQYPNEDLRRLIEWTESNLA